MRALIVLFALAQAPVLTSSSLKPVVTPAATVDPLHPIFEFATDDAQGMGAWDGGDAPSCGQCNNPIPYPQNLDNAVWSAIGGVVAAPTVTANAATAPDGTLTAERFQIPAAGAIAAAYSQVYQTFGTLAAGAYSCGVFVKGNGTSGTLNFRMQDTTPDNVNDCTGCSYNASTWTHCVFTPSVDGTAVTASVGSFSTTSYPCTGSTGAAFDGYVWGYSCTSGDGGTTYYATPSGTRDEPLVFARASSATCLKQSQGAGIANGDLTTCYTGVPRVTYGGDGGTGSPGLGLLSEEARTNSCLRSEEFDNASWTLFGLNAAPPVVTANQAIAPDGTLTADRVQFAATTDPAASVIYIEPAAGPLTVSGSIFVKGNGTSGTLDFAIYTGAAYSCGSCSYVADSWTRCTRDNISQSGNTPTFLIGNSTWASLCVSVPHSAQDVFFWGAQYENGAFTTSYIPTTTAQVARVVDVPYVTVSGTAFNTSGSAAATVVMNQNTATSGTSGGLLTFTSARPLSFNAGGGTPGGVSVFDGTAVVITTAGSNFNRNHRVWSSWAAATMTANNTTDSLTASGAFDGTMQSGATSLEIGYNAGGSGSLNGVIKNVSIDDSTTRCR